jgi:CRP-like cAMP-binding protein
VEAHNKHPAAVLEKIRAVLPLTTYLAGETILKAGSKTGRLLILNRGSVAIIKDSVEIARVAHPGAVIGELSALLDQPHGADVRALEDSQFHVAEPALLEKDPAALLHVAKILAQRLVAADDGLVELKKQIVAGQSSSTLKKITDKIQKLLNADSSGFSPGL